jgi:hypothetical protein
LLQKTERGRETLRPFNICKNKSLHIWEWCNLNLFIADERETLPHPGVSEWWGALHAPGEVSSAICHIFFVLLKHSCAQNLPRPIIFTAFYVWNV